MQKRGGELGYEGDWMWRQEQLQTALYKWANWIEV